MTAIEDIRPTGQLRDSSQLVRKVERADVFARDGCICTRGVIDEGPVLAACDEMPGSSR